MGGVSILYLMMSGFMGTLTEEGPLPSVALAVGLVLLFVVLSLVTHLQQYKACLLYTSDISPRIIGDIRRGVMERYAFWKILAVPDHIAGSIPD